MMNSSSKKSSSNKITDIVRLHQILKKWKKLAHHKDHTRTNTSAINGNGNAINAMMIVTNNNASSAGAGGAPPPTTSSSSSINKFLKKTLSFSEREIPKGYLAVCVGEELKRFVIPMEYLGHQAFALLLREAEEEFGFQQEGVLKIPCQVPVFENILKMLESPAATASKAADIWEDINITSTTSQLGHCEHTRHPHHHPHPHPHSHPHPHPPPMCR